MSTNPTPIQFDNAEFGQGPSVPGGVACAACKRPIVDQYYEAASQVFCETCAGVLKAGPKGGSPVWRTIEALIGGLIGGVLGAIPYFLILRFAGYEIGLIAIVVGVFVGLGVKRGARGRGGWYYQAMAMVITYAAIVATYVPLIIKSYDEFYTQLQETIIKQAENPVKLKIKQDGRVLVDGEEANETQWKAALDRAKEAHGTIFYYREGRSESPPSPVADAIFEEAASRELYPAIFEDAEYKQPADVTFWGSTRTPRERIVSLANLFVMAAKSPFDSPKDNIIGLFIIAIALYEAWKINKKPVLAVTGPFVLSPSGSLGSGSIVHVPPPATPPNPPSAFDEPPQGPAST